MGVGDDAGVPDVGTGEGFVDVAGPSLLDPHADMRAARHKTAASRIGSSSHNQNGFTVDDSNPAWLLMMRPMSHRVHIPDSAELDTLFAAGNGPGRMT